MVAILCHSAISVLSSSQEQICSSAITKMLERKEEIQVHHRQLIQHPQVMW